MIIIEGPDNTGKTTLMDRLIEDIGLIKAPMKFNPHDKEDVCQYVKDFYDVAYNYLSQHQILKEVWDRIYFSELIYGPLKRDGVCFTEEQSILLPQLLKKIRPLVIICNTDIETIKNNLHEREQYINENEIEEMKDQYDRLYDKVTPITPYIYHYNYKHDDYDSLKHFVQLYIRVMEGIKNV